MTSEPEKLLDWQSLMPAKTVILDEIIRQAEARLQVQLQAALAADARAGLLASIQGAASAALFIAGAQDNIRGVPELAAYLSAACLAVGAFCAAWAARPIPFGYVGSYPSGWLEVIEKRESLQQARAWTAANLDEWLRFNDRAMVTNNKWTRRAIFSLVLAPIAAALTLLAGSICGVAG